MSTLSIILIVKNESQVIDRCLSSVSWADEIIVFDSGSTDDTVERARSYTDKVFVTDWPGFGIQRQRAYAEATGDWVLWIDADEWCSPELQTEIQACVADPANVIAGYALRRRLVFNNKPIRYADGAHTVLRLCRREKGHIDPLPIHEKLIVDGKTATLQGTLWHESYRSLEDLLERTNRYSTIGAELRRTREKSSSLGKAIVHGAWTFFRVYILQRGFLDGREGFVLAVSFAEGCYYRYLKAAF